MIKLKTSGNFKNTERLLNNINNLNINTILSKYGQEGVNALQSATPIDSGLTSSSWKYEINVTQNRWTISWSNTNVVSGVPIAIILQYGHGTRNGGYVQGIDYINPALKPIFDKIRDDVWMEVTK